MSASRFSGKIQYLFSVSAVLIVSVICFFFRHFLGYKTVALILLMTVSVVAMLCEIWPVLLSAVLSAIIWNFFFIPPLFTFAIGNTEDGLMFLLYFLIALVNGVLNFKIRKAEKKAREREEKQNELKLYDTLLNSLSHELRTPISTVLGSVDVLKENMGKLSPSRISGVLNEIEIAGMRLNRQVENILHINRLESGMLKPKEDWTDMNEIVNAVIHKLAADEHMIIFQNNDQLPLFRLDAGFTEQIIYNLLHNAIQYTPAGSLISIDVRHEAECCVIVIADEGSGFREDEMQHVFDKFYRLPHSKAGGSGLGLSIVKGFAEAQGGKVILENNERGGATFIVEIPADVSYLNKLKNE